MVAIPTLQSMLTIVEDFDIAIENLIFLKLKWTS